MRLVGVLAVGIVALALTPACSLLVDTSGLWGGSEATSDKPGADGTLPSPDAGPAHPDDRPVAAPLPCDPNETPNDGVFASEAGDDKATGTRALPVKTVARALELATSSKKIVVYLEEGMYREAVVLSAAHAGMTIRAGWRRAAATWTRDCADDVARRTTLASPGAIGLRVTGAAKEIVIERLTIATKPVGDSTPDQSGESTFGVFAEASTLRLRGTIIEAGAGGAGGFASDRAAAANDDCDGTTTCSSGAPGTPASQGAPASSTGKFDPTGYVPADGASGAPGKPGSNGTAGGKSPTPCAACSGGSACLVVNNCMPGPALSITHGKGRCGCGGKAGLPGGAGRGGGASVAIFAIGGEVTLESATAHAGVGGRGSSGGQGGAGGSGTPGAIGDASGQFCASSCAPTTNPGPACFCTTKNVPIMGGAPGSAGGAGSAGGKGGGGAGGPSHAVVTSGGGRVVRDAKSILVATAAGKGADGAPDGASSDVSAF